MTERAALEQALVLQAEFESRRANDPWWNWVPHAKQEPFIRAVLVQLVAGELDEVWAYAANRSGKSDAASFCGASLARFGKQSPRYQSAVDGVQVVPPSVLTGWVISRTVRNSIGVIQPKYFNNHLAIDPGHAPFIPEREIENWSATHSILTLKNGNFVCFPSVESGAERAAGPALDWAQFDEEPEEPFYEEITLRVGGGRNLMIFGAATLLPPEGEPGGVSWMFDRKIKPWQAGKTPRIAIYGASIYDNPHIARAEIARLESLYPEGSPSRAIRLDGEFRPGMQGTRAYGAFDRRLHVRPQPTIPPRRPLVWMLDFNVEPMISLIGSMEGRLFRVHHELVVEDDASVEQMVDTFKRKVPQHFGPIWVYGDASGRARHAVVGRSEYSLLVNFMASYGTPVTLKVPEKNPFVPDRVNAVNHVLRGEKGEIDLEVDPSCEELIDDLEQVQRSKDGGIRKSSDRKERYSRRTHASDALGYWLHYERPIRRASHLPFVATPPYDGRAAEPSYAFRRET